MFHTSEKLCGMEMARDFGVVKVVVGEKDECVVADAEMRIHIISLMYKTSLRFYHSLSGNPTLCLNARQVSHLWFC